jgi:hypothetical protein
MAEARCRRCFFFRHKWQVEDAFDVKDVSFGPEGEPFTRVLWRCSACRKLKTKRISGYWADVLLKDAVKS